ncbi:HD-GYP domain-containing protein [Desulfotalea psychrophila]|uniref:HD-GYP domain-containing protein n=1 Tax=Desulfotalea psychrophila (strain LSv54 / DSM 12343) TaxID=177439 RepID=Q6AKY9_DESPS|nr:HD domain-containing phosphohydrolase [Desulfotalea psychrophila]CAG36986.1 hypothetical protein DP2257 [Desulfotalea psychrophila LSv54]
MKKLSLRELAVPMIKSIDSFNYLLKSHHRRTAVVSYYIGKKLNLNNTELVELVIAAALHDIGALSVQERDMIVQEDVINPAPHCMMGYRMLASLDVFKNISQIIKHHHIKYQDSLNAEEGEILLQSHIIHLADRVDILVSPNEFITNQKSMVTEKIREKAETTFHPEVFKAFEEVSKADIFWIEMNNLEMEQLLRKIDFGAIDFELTIDDIIEFTLTMSRIIDFRSKFTASHSYTVAHLSSLIGGYFGFSEEKCKKLLIAGYLHDIGKIGIDPRLIEKNGPLNDEEFNLIKLHAYYTGQILNELNTSDWFSEIVTWAERHHEKSDGTGYPFSLDDTSLDEGVKILSCSDIISALMEERPYRESLSVDVAFDIIRDNMSASISPDMFEVIEQHKYEINDLVLQCQAHTFEEYRLGSLQ